MNSHKIVDSTKRIGYTNRILDEILIQSKVEFNYQDTSELVEDEED